MANKLNFSEWSGVTFDISKLNVNDSQRSISKNNTTKLNNNSKGYGLNVTYPYTYLVQTCVQPLIDETITYIVGSDTELDINISGTPVYSFQSLQNPSITVCGFVINEPFSGDPEYVMVNTYVDCDEAYTSNYKVVILENCIMPSAYTPWVVDNRFNVDDILFVDFTTDFYPYSPYRLTFNAPGKIVDIIPWSEFPIGDLSTTLTPVNYITYSSCDEAVEANGVYYITDGCNDLEEVATLIHKVYDTPATILIPTATSPVKVLITYISTLPTYVISGGTTEIFSTIKIADGEDCPLGLSMVSPNGIINSEFYNGGFSGGTNGPLVHTTVEQPEGKILVGGHFDDYDGTTVNNFMRLDSDGYIDETFNPNNNKLLLDNPSEPISIIKQQGYIFTLDHANNVINVSKVVNNKMVSVISNYDTTSLVEGGFPWQIYGDGTNLYVVFDNAGIGVWRFNTSSETLRFITKTEGQFCEQYSQIWGDGDYIYASTASSDGGNQTLKAFQLSGTSLNVVGEWGELNTYNSVYCQNGYIFVGIPFSGLYVVTFDGEVFRDVISIPNTGDIVAVNGDGTNIYVVDYNSDLTSYYLNTSHIPPTPTPTNTTTPTSTPTNTITPTNTTTPTSTPII